MPGRKNASITKEQILSTIQAIAKDLGRAPTREELERLGGIPPTVVRNRFGKHRTAVRAAGLEPTRTGPERVKNERLLEDWGKVVRRLQGAPTQLEYQGAGQYSARCLIERFQRWSLVPTAFVQATSSGEAPGKWNDVLEMIRKTPPPMRGGRWMKQLLQAVRREKRPACATGAVTAHASILPPLAGKKCVTATMLAVLVASIVLGGGFLRRVLPDRPLLGPPLHTATLAHEPVNEMGVSMLFAMMARDLGFIIESVQAAFPDCRAKMEVLPGRWQDVRIEFEKESRNFAEHGHDPKGCDMIVCWRHNWKQCPPEIQVIELSKVLGRS
jgi:hypothetical protein